jgi:CRP-like cAMP-binding protein
MEFLCHWGFCYLITAKLKILKIYLQKIKPAPYILQAAFKGPRAANARRETPARESRQKHNGEIMKRYTNAITNNLFFKEMSAAEIEMALFYLKPKIAEYKRGSYITMMGDRADSVYILLKGCVQIIMEDEFGARAATAQYRAGNFFMEAFAFADVETNPAASFAVENSLVLSVYNENIKKMQAGDKVIWYKIMSNLFESIADKNIKLHRQLGCVSQPTLRMKIFSYLLEKRKQAGCAGSQEFVLPVSKSDLANYLFINRSAMTRELAAMKKEKILSFKGRRFVLYKNA